MNIDTSFGATSGAGAVRADGEDEARLKSVCRDVEGVFLSMLLKEGLKSMTEGEGDSSHASAILETTIEQVASQMAGAGSLGIANMLHEQMAGASRPAPERNEQ